MKLTEQQIQEAAELNLREIKQQIRDNIQWGSKKPKISGGQQCGIINYPVTLRSEELELEITIGYHRTSLKNKELAFTLFDLALDELVK